MKREKTSGEIILLQAAIPDYRQAFLDSLTSLLGEKFLIYAGEVQFESTVRTNIQIGNVLRLIKNHYLLGRRFLWQSIPLKKLLRADVVILELNPRILSVWVVLLLRAVLRRRTVLWGHAWSRKGRGSKTNFFRPIMWYLADALLMYTEREADEVRPKAFNRLTVGAGNAIYGLKQLPKNISSGRQMDIIYVGRLVQSKKPQLLALAFVKIAKSLPRDARLIIVGDGPVRKELEELVDPIKERVCFAGYVHSSDLLDVYYSDALVSVSPGYAGLSLTQSLWFGVPMIIAKDEPHAPEIEAARDAENCEWFESGSVDDLCRVLLEVYSKAPIWRARRSAISMGCVQAYSAEGMAKRFIRAICGQDD